MLRDPAGVRTTTEVEGGCLRETGCGRAQTAKLDYGMIARFFRSFSLDQRLGTCFSRFHVTIFASRFISDKRTRTPGHVYLGVTVWLE